MVESVPAHQLSQAKEEQPPDIPAGQILPLWWKNDLIWNGGRGYGGHSNVQDAVHVCLVGGVAKVNVATVQPHSLVLAKCAEGSVTQL